MAAAARGLRALGASAGAAAAAAFAYGAYDDARRQERHAQGGVQEARARTAAAALQRSLRTLGTAAVVSVDYKFSLGGLTEGEDDYLAARLACHERSARRMLELCRANAGFYIKVAQYVSTLSVPQPFVDALSSLQDRAVQSSAESVRRTLASQLGAGVADEMLRGIDLDAPVGCASLAQVHRAELPDGTAVAVKVQHESVAEELATDVATLRAVVAGVHMAFGWDFRWAVPDFERHVRQELDFTHEGRNAERAASNLERSRLPVHVPSIHWELTTDKVLVMEWCEGTRATNLELLEANSASAKEAARLLAETFAEQVCVHGFVHADLHPGNLLFRGVAGTPTSETPSGGMELVLLDHGAYRELDDQIRVAYCSLLRAVAVGDEAGAERAAVTLLGESGQMAARFLPLMLAGPVKGKNESPRMAALRAEARKMKLDDVAKLLDNMPVALLATLRAGRVAQNVSERMGLDRAERLIVQARAALRGRRNAHAEASSDGGGASRLRTELDIVALDTYVKLQRTLELFGVGRLAAMRRQAATEATERRRAEEANAETALDVNVQPPLADGAERVMAASTSRRM